MTCFVVINVFGEKRSGACLTTDSFGNTYPTPVSENHKSVRRTRFRCFLS